MNRLLLVFTGPGCKEMYDNLAKLVSKLDSHLSSSVVFCADLKVIKKSTKIRLKLSENSELLRASVSITQIGSQAA